MVGGQDVAAGAGRPRVVGVSAPLHASYILPLRWTSEQQLDLTGYLHWLAQNVEKVIVVDGSPETLFERHHRSWSRWATHLPPDPSFACRYGKVTGVLTGVAIARHEKLIIADDDVRYDREGLERVVQLLEDGHVVRPQNYFDPLPWHAAWDTARTLLNRAFGRDYPGTLGVRRSLLLATDGYDGDALFENLELMRTAEAAGGTLVSPLDLYVERRPPDAEHFLSQRVRQAYDDFAMPPRMAFWLLLAPAAAATAKLNPVLPATAAGASIVLAEVGRRRAGGARVFPFRSALAAPLWLAERSVTAWMAVGSRLAFGGVRYAGTVFSKAASSKRALRRKHAGKVLPMTRTRRQWWPEQKAFAPASSTTTSSARSSDPSTARGKTRS